MKKEGVCHPWLERGKCKQRASAWASCLGDKWGAQTGVHTALHHRSVPCNFKHSFSLYFESVYHPQICLSPGAAEKFPQNLVQNRKLPGKNPGPIAAGMTLGVPTLLTRSQFSCVCNGSAVCVSGFLKPDFIQPKLISNLQWS